MKVVIVGAGEVGFHVANHLALENIDVVVIDKDPAAIRRISDNIDVQVLNGSGSSPVILEEAGIQEAEIILAVIGNIGPGFGMVGPVDNYAQIPYLGKWLLIWCMLLGRLEIFTIIILVVPEFWRK